MQYTNYYHIKQENIEQSNHTFSKATAKYFARHLGTLEGIIFTLAPIYRKQPAPGELASR